MRTRKILAPIIAVGFGVLASATLAAPAQAYTAPSVSVTDECSNIGDRTIVIKNLANDVAINVQAVRNGAPAKLKNNLASGDTATVTKTWKESFKIQYQKVGGAGWDDLKTVGEWTAPDRCKPQVTIVKPTCDDPTLSVSIANPVDAKADVTVEYNNGGGVQTVSPGYHYAIDGATQDVVYSWHAPNLGLNAVDVKVEYVKPTGCNGDEPGAGEVVPGPGKPIRGKGTFHHTNKIAWHGGNGGSQSSSSSSSSSSAATGGGAKGSSGGSGLPVTGAPAGLLVAVGAVALVGGVLVVAALRRRRAVRFTA